MYQILPMIRYNFPLEKYNTFGLKYLAKTFVTVRTEDEIFPILRKCDALSKPLLVLGGGSNLLFMQDFSGTILHPEMKADPQIEEIITSSGDILKRPLP